MNTPRLVVIILIVCGLLVLTLQNLSLSLSITFLGLQTLALPLGVWLSGAIALGVLTALLFPGNRMLPGGSGANRRRRRRWQVQSPADPQAAQTPKSGRSSSQGPPPADFSSGSGHPPATSASQQPDAPNRGRSRPTDAEDWQAWGERTPASQWEDWTQASRPTPSDKRFPERQQQDRETAQDSIEDMSVGWHASAQDTVYVAPGGSDVQDALDDIADGWDDWDTDQDPPVETAYSYRYDGAEAAARVDSIYGPSDDLPPNPDTKVPATENFSSPQSVDDPDAGENGDSVYDADYRVIIPPHRPLEES